MVGCVPRLPDWQPLCGLFEANGGDPGFHESFRFTGCLTQGPVRL